MTHLSSLTITLLLSFFFSLSLSLSLSLSFSLSLPPFLPLSLSLSLARALSLFLSLSLSQRKLNRRMIQGKDEGEERKKGGGAPKEDPKVAQWVALQARARKIRSVRVILCCFVKDLCVQTPKKKKGLNYFLSRKGARTLFRVVSLAFCQLSYSLPRHCPHPPHLRRTATFCNTHSHS